MTKRDPKRLDDAYLRKWNKTNRTVKTYNTEFRPRKVKSDRFVPDLLDRPKKG